MYDQLVGQDGLANHSRHFLCQVDALESRVDQRADVCRNLGQRSARHAHRWVAALECRVRQQVVADIDHVRQTIQPTVFVGQIGHTKLQ